MKDGSDEQPSKSLGEQTELDLAEDASTKRVPRPRPRVIRRVLLNDHQEEPTLQDSIERPELTQEVYHAKTAHWKPTSPAGQRDLRSLVQSLKEMSAQFKQRTQEGPSGNGEDPSLQWQANETLELPISPLEKHMQKKKWKPKRQPTAEEKEKLAGNPWAAMLAGSMRLDAATKARFPVALLMDVGHVENPEDNNIYILPDELADLEAFNQRLKNGQRSAAMKRSIPGDAGEKIRILPYRLLLEELTDSFMGWDNAGHVGRTKKGAVSKRLYPGRWSEGSKKIAAYQKASEEYWDLREEQGEIDDDVFKRPEKVFDATKLQWRPDIAERIPSIMRQRVLLAMNHIGQKQNQPNDIKRKYFYSFEWPEAGSLTLVDEATSKRVPISEYWNDMGDIEAVDAITGTGKGQGNKSDPRPPIAVLPSEINQDPGDAMSEQPNPRPELSNLNTSGKRDKDDPTVWLPGSFILHIGPPRTSLSGLPYLNASLSVSSTDNFDATDPAFEHSKYIPPMITVAANPDTHTTYRLPVFNLPALLGPKFARILSRVLERHKRHLGVDIDPLSPELKDLDGTNFNRVIIVKSVAPGSHFLAQELWQLWRYVGGRDCLFAAAGRRGQGGGSGTSLAL